MGRGLTMPTVMATNFVESGAAELLIKSLLYRWIGILGELFALYCFAVYKTFKRAKEWWSIDTLLLKYSYKQWYYIYINAKNKVSKL